jgi:exonuclease VII large subunit
MQHLEPERMAAFDHDAPGADELAHLAACLDCRAERLALAQVAAHVARARSEVMTNLGQRLTDWDRLAVQLRTEGLLTSPPSQVDVVTPRMPAFTSTARPFRETSARARADGAPLAPWVTRAKPTDRNEWWRVAAAALLLVLGGGALGRVSAGASAVPGTEPGSQQAASVFGVSNLLGSTGYSSLDDATRALNRAQRDYERAALWLAANDTTAKSSDMVRRRLAALDQMVAASRAGLESAPQDPVLNRYYAAAYAMREATLQQLGGALPVGRSIERF